MDEREVMGKGRRCSRILLLQAVLRRCVAGGAPAWDIPWKAVWAVTRNDLGSTAALCHCTCIFPFFKLCFQLCNQRLSLVQHCDQLARLQIRCAVGEGEVDEAENTKSHLSSKGVDQRRGKCAGSTQGMQFRVDLGI